MLQDRCLDEGEMDITEMVDDGTARREGDGLRGIPQREDGPPVDLGFPIFRQNCFCFLFFLIVYTLLYIYICYYYYSYYFLSFLVFLFLIL